MNLTFREIMEFAQMFSKSPICMADLDTGGTRLRLSKAQSADRQDAETTPKGNADMTGAKEEGGKKHDDSTYPDISADAPHGGDGVWVKSPIAGTFYMAPKPGDPPFVTPGKAVCEGDIIGLIEAMKIMNEIRAPMDGTIGEIAIGDGEFAEYGAKLMEICG